MMGEGTLFWSPAGQEEVFWLKVPVHDTKLVAVVEHVHHLSKASGRFALRVRALLNNGIKQLATAAELHDYVDKVLVLICCLRTEQACRCICCCIP